MTKEVNLDLPSTLPKSVADDIKKEVGDFVVTSILDYVGQGKSPVTGRSFKQLSEEYADDKKGGRREPNLDLEGDMLNSLKAELTPKGIEVGIFDGSQAPKAYNHCVGDTLPKRQFIPEPKQRFVGDIEKGIAEIVARGVMENDRGSFQAREEPRRTPSDERSGEEIRRDFTPVQSASIFDSFIKGLLDG